MKIDKFRGELTNISAKKDPLVVDALVLFSTVFVLADTSGRAARNLFICIITNNTSRIKIFHQHLI